MNAVNQRGMTLIELVVAMLVLGIAGVSIIAFLSTHAARSGELLVRNEAAQIANAYLTEVMSRPFSDPDGASESRRSEFDDIDDYQGLTETGAHTANGTAVVGLDNYTVRITLTPAALATVPSTDCKQIDVLVTHPSGVQVLLTAYRARGP